jgi:TonB-linked SusC/RagA family outer membrane protein
METQEIPVNGRSIINVVLTEETVGLNEVVVIGYGTQKKGDVTSSISSVKSTDFVKGAVKDAAQLIQGKVSGLSITTPSGNPTDNTQIMLRGITTLKSETSPLILIDGIPGNLSTVASEDIETIDVLKDGSSAAIYGTRGTNGVILITTKQISGEMPATAEYSAYASVQTIARQADFMNAADYRRLIGEGKLLNDFGSSTDWLKEITRTPISQMHNLSLKGGSKTTNYVASVNFKQTQGIFKKSDDERMNARLEVNHNLLNGKIKLNGGILGGVISYFNLYPYRQALIRNPTDAVTDATGNWIERSIFQYENPVAWNNETFGDNRNTNLRFHESITIAPFRGLKLKILGASDRNVFYSGYSETKKHISTIRDGKNGFASRSTSASVANLLEITGEYNRIFAKNNLTVMGGYSYNDYTGENFYMDNFDFPTDAFSYNNMGMGNALLRGEATMTSYKSSSRLISFFGRASYNYDDKYLLMGSVRQEGSSKFGKNYQWGLFPAVSAGWRISKESFFKGISFIDDLKLRAGFGVTGTEPSSPYMSLTRLQYSDRILVNGKWIQQIIPASNPNPDLRWEKKEELNFGIDFSALKARISGSVDYYIRTTKDMLWDYQVPTPPYLYSSITANVGEMQNKGLEVLLNFIPVKKEHFQWSTGISYSTNKNKLVSLSNDLYKTSNDYFDWGYTGDPIQQATHRVKIGEPIGNFWGVKSIGIDENGIWIIEGKDGNPKSIEAKTEDDKRVIGNGLPKHYAAWNNTLKYKNFDLNVTMRGAFGFQILNFQRMFYENPTINIRYNVLKTAYDKVYGKSVLAYTQDYVSYYIEDGDYWKIDNVTLGYTFDVSKVKFVRSARVYISGLNMATITGYKGIDPEVNRMGLDPGNDDRDKYPTTRTFSFGLNLTF